MARWAASGTRACKKVGSGLLAALADGVHERHDRRLDLIAKRIEALGGKAALVLVEPNIVWVALGVHELGLMLKLGDDSIHIGLKARPVIGRLGFVPHGIGLAGEPGPGLGLLGGDDACLALVTAEHADLVEQLRVVDLAADDGLARQRAYELNGLFRWSGAYGARRQGCPWHRRALRRRWRGAMVAPSNSAILSRYSRVHSLPSSLRNFFDGLIDLHAFGRLARCGLCLLIVFLSHTISLISRAERHRWAHGQFAQLPALYPARTKRNAAIRSHNVVSYSPMR